MDKMILMDLIENFVNGNSGSGNCEGYVNTENGFVVLFNKDGDRITLELMQEDMFFEINNNHVVTVTKGKKKGV